MPSITFTPEAVSANTNITIPGTTKFSSLSSVFLFNAGEHSASVDDAPTELTIVTSTPSAGEILLVDSGTVELGDATDGFDHLELHGVSVGQFLQTS